VVAWSVIVLLVREDTLCSPDAPTLVLHSPIAV
jgi:hypothetical protein